MLCSHRALLIVTHPFSGTSSSVAKERVELRCHEPAGHEGPHRDPERGESWEDRGSELTHVLRHEDAEG